MGCVFIRNVLFTRRMKAIPCDLFITCWEFLGLQNTFANIALVCKTWSHVLQSERYKMRIKLPTALPHFVSTFNILTGSTYTRPEIFAVGNSVDARLLENSDWTTVCRGLDGSVWFFDSYRQNFWYARCISDNKTKWNINLGDNGNVTKWCVTTEIVWCIGYDLNSQEDWCYLRCMSRQTYGGDRTAPVNSLESMSQPIWKLEFRLVKGKDDATTDISSRSGSLCVIEETTQFLIYFSTCVGIWHTVVASDQFHDFQPHHECDLVCFPVKVSIAKSHFYSFLPWKNSVLIVCFEAGAFNIYTREGHLLYHTFSPSFFPRKGNILWAIERDCLMVYTSVGLEIDEEDSPEPVFSGVTVRKYRVSCLLK